MDSIRDASFQVVPLDKIMFWRLDSMARYSASSTVSIPDIQELPNLDHQWPGQLATLLKHHILTGLPPQTLPSDLQKFPKLVLATLILGWKTTRDIQSHDAETDNSEPPVCLLA